MGSYWIEVLLKLRYSILGLTDRDLEEYPPLSICFARRGLWGWMDGKFPELAWFQLFHRRLPKS